MLHIIRGTQFPQNVVLRRLFKNFYYDEDYYTKNLLLEMVNTKEYVVEDYYSYIDENAKNAGHTF